MTAGSVKAKAAAKATVASENVAPRTETMPDKLVGVQVATPSFLPPGGLRALAARGDAWVGVSHASRVSRPYEGRPTHAS